MTHGISIKWKRCLSKANMGEREAFIFMHPEIKKKKKKKRKEKKKKKKAKRL